MGWPSMASASTKPVPWVTVSSMERRAVSLSRVAMARSGLTISTWSGQRTSLAVTVPGPGTSSWALTGSSEKERRRSFLMLSTIWVTSSLTSGMVENSWCTPSMRMEETAAPGREERSTRRMALPMVWP